MKLGMTGNRGGISNFRVTQIDKFLSENQVEEVHHGDCIGADTQFHKCAQDMGIHIFIHPPINKSLRAFCKGATILKPKPYLDRNRDIVDSTDFLIAFPSTENEIMRSGTWATIRYAKLQNKQILVILPSGIHLKINY